MKVIGSKMAGTSTSRLNNINILLIDPDRELSTIIRRILRSLGFSTIHISKDGSSALQVMHKNVVDLVITDWEMSPMSGIDFIEYVRASEHSPNPFVPIIMLTGHARRRYVEKARDTGITEFMVKPFTAKQLCDRIIQVIDNPRHFIVSPAYKGPDRRRKVVPFDAAEDRREYDSHTNIMRYRKNDIEKARQEKDVFMVDADESIRDKIGGFITANELFSEENIQQAQRIIYESREDFLDWIVTDLEALETAYKRMQVKDMDGMPLMSETTLRVKGRAGTFGYDLASKVADSLGEMCYAECISDDRYIQVVRKHIDSLYVIVQRNILGEGGAVGRDLMENLYYLSQKYKKHD